MKIYLLMYIDGYYPDSLFCDKAFSSKELAREFFEKDPPIFMDKPCELSDDEGKTFTYLIREFDVIEGLGEP